MDGAASMVSTYLISESRCHSSGTVFEYKTSSVVEDVSLKSGNGSPLMMLTRFKCWPT